MSSTEPTAASIPGAGGAKRMTLASLVALVVSVGGNVLQWQTASAELAKTRAEVTTLQQEQKEASTRSIQSWIEQLQKFDTVEDRVMVLSAAASTSPYDSVKAWAREQMLRLEGELDERKKVAEAQVAMTEAAPSPPRATPGGTRPRSPTPPTGASPEAGGTTVSPPVPTRDVDIQRVARKNLERVTLAEALLRAAKDVRPAPIPAGAPSGVR